MAILKLQPACRETIWGGQRLRKDYHMQYEGANIAEAWDKTSSSTSEAPVVAVLDSGVDYNHPDLKNIMWDDGLKYPELSAMGGGTYCFNVCDG